MLHWEDQTKKDEDEQVQRAAARVLDEGAAASMRLLDQIITEEIGADAEPFRGKVLKAAGILYWRRKRSSLTAQNL